MPYSPIQVRYTRTPIRPTSFTIERRQWLAELLAGAFLVNPESADYVLASRLRLSVWTFDRHFTSMRVKLWR